MNNGILSSTFFTKKHLAQINGYLLCDILNNKIQGVSPIFFETKELLRQTFVV